jgi:hypothetical protein
MEGITSILAGSRTPGQIENNYKSLEGMIDPSALSEMTKISDELWPQPHNEGNIFKRYP